MVEERWRLSLEECLVRPSVPLGGVVKGDPPPPSPSPPARAPLGGVFRGGVMSLPARPMLGLTGGFQIGGVLLGGGFEGEASPGLLAGEMRGDGGDDLSGDAGEMRGDALPAFGDVGGGDPALALGEGVVPLGEGGPFLGDSFLYAGPSLAPALLAPPPATLFWYRCTRSACSSWLG